MMKRVLRRLRQLFSRKREEGAAMVEYALLVALIALGAALALTNLGTTMRKLFQGIASTMNTIPNRAQ